MENTKHQIPAGSSVQRADLKTLETFLSPLLLRVYMPDFAFVYFSGILQISALGSSQKVFLIASFRLLNYEFVSYEYISLIDTDRQEFQAEVSLNDK